MKFLIIVLSTISLYPASSCGHSPLSRLVARDTSTGQDKCTPVTDNDPNTNLFNCPDDYPKDLNDCQRAGQLMIQNGWSSSGYGTCGILYFGKDAQGKLAPAVPYKDLTATILKNTLNSFTVDCCPEVQNEFQHPLHSDLGLDPATADGYTVLCAGRLDPPYQDARPLDNKDVTVFIKTNKHYLEQK
ncbi:uncharacterized protein MELLADRAFT_104326 [Melampsora larici-populina 98AG31]|uniref:Secreted protein n=1 Tax=Melampsora larici-populina (strain 98AG31 / pathotype 3-4-7) TaxID=747676 RepID=F4REB9_MELLP|nr:uncharacterized protein MELLADRAFT_104326 [Melampsora larici-populina 98AG31]EGG09062.1 secreted protein [Melampsora larici-populina 98AG31]